MSNGQSMTPDEFRAWMERLSLSRPEAAELLAQSPRTIDGWLSRSNPHRIAPAIGKLCAYIEAARTRPHMEIKEPM